MARLFGLHTMMRIIAEVFKMPNGSAMPLLYAVTETGQVDRTVTDTLCDFVTHLFPPADREFRELLEQFGLGIYIPDNPLLPDFGVNNINVWLTAPHVERGSVAISNENIFELSAEGGEPQKFLIEELQAVVAYWEKFQNLIKAGGIENIMGHKFEKLISRCT